MGLRSGSSPPVSPSALGHIDKTGTLDRNLVAGGVANVLLALVKLAAGFFFASQALVADGVHSVADVGSSVAVTIGIHISRTPADRDHPYGHGRAEIIAEDVVGIILILAGFELFGRSVGTLMSGRIGEEPGIIALYVAAGALVVKEVLFRLNRRAAVLTRSPAMMAIARDHRTDVWSSLAAAAGILGARLGYPELDALGGGIVSILVVWAGWRLVTAAVRRLMDAFPDREFLAGVREIAGATPGVKRVDGVRARQMGPFVVLDVEIAVPGSITVLRGHAIANVVQSAIRAAREEVTQVQVHVNPDPT